MDLPNALLLDLDDTILDSYGNPDEVWRRLCRELADRFTVVREEAVKPLPGVIDTLQRIREADICLGLLTDGQTRNQRRKIERFSLDGFFDHIQIEEEFGVGKPDEQAFRHALEALGVGPTEAWMVGDNLEHDIGGAQRMGIYGVWVDADGDGLVEGRLSVRTE